MTTKEITIEEEKYTISAITEGQFEEMITGEMKDSALDQNRYLVACSLNSADKGSRTKEDMKEMPRPVFVQLLAAVLEVNGLSKNS